MERIYSEDIDRCLEFANEDAAAAVSRAVHSNSLCINPVTDFSNVPRDCTLLQVHTVSVQSDPSGQMLHFVDLDLVAPMSA